MNKKTILVIVVIAVSLLVAVIAFYTVSHRQSSPINTIKNDVTKETPISAKYSPVTDDKLISELNQIVLKGEVSKKTEDALFKLADIYEKRGDLVRSRNAYRDIVEKFPNSDGIGTAVESCERLNVKLLLSPILTEDSFYYEIKKGDTLAGIAKKYNTTVDLIKAANDLRDERINFGKKLKVTKSKFSIVVDKSQNILTLKADGNIVKTYRVSTGANNSTPVGTFVITDKIVNPVWYTTGAVVPSGSPKNILGSRWIGISKKGFGIHGTTEPQSIGQSVTAGCVRMINVEVEELYTIVPSNTEVVILD